jgi:hypothetical protein
MEGGSEDVAATSPPWDIAAITSEGSGTRSAREVTRCEQPARAWAGASATQTRSDNTAPAGDRADALRGERFVIERPDRPGGTNRQP